MLADKNQVYGSILISNRNRVLVIKGRLTGKWSFPKGHARDNETESEAAARETYEETGFYPPLNFDRIVHLATGTYYVYSCNEFQPEPRDVKEVAASEWMDLKSLRSVSVNVDINTFLRQYASTLMRPMYMKNTYINNRPMFIYN